MRDTKALQATRAVEPNPYARRFGAPKWSRPITVCDDHRLFARLPEFADWDKTQHENTAVSKLRHAITLRLQYRRAVDDALSTYGDGNGVLISGVVRDHFPMDVKDNLRTLAHTSSDLGAQAYAHWRAAGNAMHTFGRKRDEMFTQAGV